MTQFLFLGTDTGFWLIVTFRYLELGLIKWDFNVQICGLGLLISIAICRGE